MKPQILVDFTQDKRSIMGALNMLRIPGFRERNLFDATFDTLDRIDRIEGRNTSSSFLREPTPSANLRSTRS